MPPSPGPGDVRRAAALSVATLEPLAGRDWSVRAGQLEWSARQTIEHLVEALTFYARDLAAEVSGPAQDELRLVCSPEASVPALVAGVGQAGAVVASVVAAAPPEARAWHPFGIADPTGFAAMACDELIVHTADIADGLAAAFHPPGDLCERVLGRLFPEAPSTGDAWLRLAWANGRAGLPDRPRREPDWRWHAAPLDEPEGGGTAD